MRFWQKIFLISLAVLTVAVNTIAYLLIGNNHQLNKEKEIKSSVDEYSIVVSSFQTNVLYERYRSSEAELDDTQITQIAREFSYLFTLDNLYIQLNKGEERVFSNFTRDLPDNLYENVNQLSEGDARVLIRRDDDSRVYLYITSPVTIQSSNYFFTTIKDITNIYDVKNDQLRFFSVLGPIVSVVVAFIMLILSKLLTSRINRLRKSTMKVANGEYNAIEIKSKDEIGELTADFNTMTEAVKQKVEKLEDIVAQDSKGRYRFNGDHSKIKACQGHSIPWVEPELEYLTPPEFLYHGTTTAAVEKIRKSGAISKMSRHAVHLQADPEKAWQSAVRWHQTPVVLKIDAKKMSDAGFVFGKTENDVWCTESVPVEYIAEYITD